LRQVFIAITRVSAEKIFHSYLKLLYQSTRLTHQLYQSNYYSRFVGRIETSVSCYESISEKNVSFLF